MGHEQKRRKSDNCYAYPTGLLGIERSCAQTWMICVFISAGELTAEDLRRLPGRALAG